MAGVAMHMSSSASELVCSSSNSIAALEHERDAVFVQAEDLAAVGPRRRRERSTVRQTLPAEDLRTVAGSEAAHEPQVVEHEQPVVGNQRRRIVGRGLGLDHAINSFDVWSADSEMSPLAPGRIA